MNDSEFSAVFAEQYAAVLAFCRRRVGHRDGEDAAAETFAIAWRRWDDAPSNCRPWLFGIAKNVMRDYRRGHDRRLRLHTKLAMQPAEGDEDTPDRAGTIDLQRAWMRLSLADRETIALVAWDGLATAEAAQVLSITPAAYATRLSRARKRLRKYLHGEARTTSHE